MYDVSVVKTAAVVPQEINEDLCRRFCKFLDTSEKSRETYFRAVRQFFKWMAEQGISRPEREDVKAYKDYLLRKCKPSTVTNYIVALRLFFKWTANEGIYPNVSEHLKGARLDRSHKKDYLTSKQVKAVLSDIDRETVQGGDRRGLLRPRMPHERPCVG